MLELIGLSGSRYSGSGPGPKEIIRGNPTLGYFGALTQDELFTGGEVLTATGINAPLKTDANLNWLKFSYNGRILYFPSQYLFDDVAWSSFYAAGIVYGDNTTGVFPLTPAVLQNKRISKVFDQTRHEFAIRLPKASIVDPSDLTVDYGGEFFGLFAKVIKPGTPNASFATGEWDVLQAPIINLNKYTPTQTSLTSNTGNAIWTMFSGGVTTASKYTNPGVKDRGCLLVLELVY